MKTHPDTLGTVMNMANVYSDGLEDFANVEEMYKHALDGNEKSLVKDNESKKEMCKELGDPACPGA